MDATDAWDTALVVGIVLAVTVFGLLALAGIAVAVASLARWLGSGAWRKDLWR